MCIKLVFLREQTGSLIVTATAIGHGQVDIMEAMIGQMMAKIGADPEPYALEANTNGEFIQKYRVEHNQVHALGEYLHGEFTPEGRFISRTPVPPAPGIFNVVLICGLLTIVAIWLSTRLPIEVFVISFLTIWCSGGFLIYRKFVRS